MDNMFARSSNNVDEENPYWMSFSDLMSGLLVIFILAAIALIIELTQKTQQIDDSIEELKKAEQARRNIILEMQEELAQKNIRVEIADNDTVIRIPESTLGFASGQHEIPNNEQMQAAVREIGKTLHTAIIKQKRFRYLDTVFVEGHTDSEKIWYRGKGNWGLSADRAISIWDAWETELDLQPKLNAMNNAYGQKLFSVSGYAASRRVDLTEETEAQKARNRRIDIRFTVKKPSIAEIESIKSGSPRTPQGSENE